MDSCVGYQGDEVHVLLYQMPSFAGEFFDAGGFSNGVLSIKRNELSIRFLLQLQKCGGRLTVPVFVYTTPNKG